MNTQPKSRNFTVAVILFLIIFISGYHRADAALYPIRNLTLDTLGKSLYAIPPSAGNQATLKEFNGTTTLKTWKVEYEKKGHSRGVCEPPVLNFSFDKLDSRGRPKELFTGSSTYPGFPALQYQKIRLIPDCDVWNEYFGYGGDTGFSGQANVLLREYIIAKIFRKFGVMTSDVIGFTNITFVTTDPGFENRTYRYLIVQRPSELDDQQPFTTQFSLKPQLYESGDDSPWGADYSNSNRLTNVLVTNRNTGTTTDLALNPETTIRFLLLTDFLTLGDMGYLHNEDMGVNKVTGLTNYIPHGFDSSFGCYSTPPNQTELSRLVNGLDSSIRGSYQDDYYRIARDIFGSNLNYQKMISFVDDFPYTDRDKTLMKEYLKLKFHQYAKYFGSEDFATSMNQAYSPLETVLPFNNQTEFDDHATAFINNCQRVKSVPNGVTVTTVGTPTINANNATFLVDVKTTDSGLQMTKSRGGNSFDAKLIGTKQGDFGGYIGGNISTNYDVVSGNIEDYPGPYYTVPPNSTVRLRVTANIYEDYLMKDTYRVRLQTFTPNGNALPFTLNADTLSIELGSLEPITVTSPSSSDRLVSGDKHNIKWTGNLGRDVNITIGSSQYQRWDVTNNNVWPRESLPDNTFEWNVGDVYHHTYSNNEWKYEKMTLRPGRYKIYVQDAQAAISDVSEEFIIGYSSASTSPSVESITTPVLGMKYTSTSNSTDSEEYLLKATYKVMINPGSKDNYIYKYGSAFSVHGMSDNGDYAWGDVSYSKPDRAINIDDSYYLIPKLSTTTFDVNVSFNPKRMLPGSYRAIMNEVMLGRFDKGSSQEWLSVTDSNITNKVTVIGEGSSFITSVDPYSVPANKTVTIQGVRFSTTTKNTVILRGQNIMKTYPVVTKDPTKLEFIPNVKPGFYYLQVTTPKFGGSNYYGLQVTIPTIGTSTPEVKIPVVQVIQAAPTMTPTPSITPKPSVTPSPTITPKPLMTATPLPTATLLPTKTVAPTASPVSSPVTTPTATQSVAPTQTTAPVYTQAPAPSVTSTPVPTSTATPESTITPTASVTTTPTPSATITSTPVPSTSSTVSPSGTPISSIYNRSWVATVLDSVGIFMDGIF